MNSSCVGCHAVRGTEATAPLGPDLTHVASRRTIAGVVENTRANMFEFVSSPQELKPGVTMPPSEVTGDELEALIDYLESLD